MQKLIGLVLDENYKPQKDRIGQKVGKLTIVSLIGYFKKSAEGSSRGKEAAYKCLCDCGNKHIVRGGNIFKKNPKTLSCGCHKSENSKRRHELNRPFLKGTNPETYIYNKYKRVAKERDYSFDLTKEEFLNLIYQDCFYCNEKSSEHIYTINIEEKVKHIRNGIDRLNNTKGYTIENSVPCCIICNRAKHALEFENFTQHIEKIYLNLVEKGLLNPQVSI